MKALIKNNLTQGQGLSATQKLSLVVGSASVLYLLPTEADAAIIHVTTPLTINQGQPSGTQVFWDVDGVGGNDFVLERFFGAIFLDSDGGLNGQGVVQTAGQTNNDVPKKLSLNELVGPTLAAAYQWGAPAATSRTVMKDSNVGSDFAYGGFIGDTAEYFGFRFLSGGDTFYGWANITIDTTTNGGTATITEWAYNNTADGGICVGQTTGDGPDCIESESVPEPSSSLALLAFGAAGVYRWRKNRKSKTVQEKQAA